MAITLDTLTLDEELVWVDEFTWSDLNMVSEYTLQGKQSIQESSVLANQGRPITLGSGNAWITRADLITLHTWSNDPNKTMTLTLNDARVFTVRFMLWDKPVIDTETIILEQGVVDSDTLYRLSSLKLAIV